MEKKRLPLVRRIQATINFIQSMTRNPEYREDFLLWKSGKMHDLELMFKYGIAFVIDPASPLLKETLDKSFEELDSEWQGYVKEEFDTFFIREWASQAVYVVPYNESWVSIDEDGKHRAHYERKLRDEQFLTLEIDLSQKKEYIMNEIENIIDEYSRYVSKDNSRDMPERTINRFFVWDEHIRSKSFETIAEENHCNVSTVEKAFKRAFRDIMDRDYDPNAQQDKYVISKAQLNVMCEVCPNLKNCDTICPDIEAFLEQDSHAVKDAFHKITFTGRADNFTDKDDTLPDDLCATINKSINMKDKDRDIDIIQKEDQQIADLDNTSNKVVTTEDVDCMDNVEKDQDNDQGLDDLLIQKRRQSDLLAHINQILSKNYPSLDTALKYLNKKELKILSENPLMETFKQR
jgi:hypothetical protein